MKTAFLHYWLVNMRGGENVLAEFCKLYPDADIYTHAYNHEKMEPPITEHTVYETFIGKLPGARINCQKYLPLMPRALSKLDLSQYDLILSSESGPAKGIRKSPHTTHICYCHTPMRYLWDMYEDYYRNTGLCGKIAMTVFKNYLRKYDLKSAECVDHFIANSAFVADRIKRIYGRESAVIHPPVDVDYFSADAAEKQDFYLCAGQLTKYKRADLAVEACIRNGKKLIIAGTGEQLNDLRKMAAGHNNIEFLGRTERAKLRELYAGAKALLFPGVEDFGIVPLEAQASGTPVIALGIGGALETVKDHKTGVFFHEATAEALCNAMEELESISFDTNTLRTHAESFNAARFRREMADFIAKCGK